MSFIHMTYLQHVSTKNISVYTKDDDPSPSNAAEQGNIWYRISTEYANVQK